MKLCQILQSPALNFLENKFHFKNKSQTQRECFKLEARTWEDEVPYLNL